MSTLLRNIAGQRVGVKALTTAGAPVTTGVTVRVAKDGVYANSAGTLAHKENGDWEYLPTQGETDAYDVWLSYTVPGGFGVLEKYKTAFGDYDGGIWIDTDDSNTNTVVGVDGTRQKPVSTAAAARTLADSQELGLKQFFIKGTVKVTLDANDYKGWKFVGIDALPTLDVNSQNTNNAIFENLVVTGAMNAGATDGLYTGCIIDTVTNMRGGFFTRCLLTGTLSLATSVRAAFLDCFSGTGVLAVTFDVGNKDQVNIVGHNGKIVLANVTGAATRVDVAFNTGDELELLASCTNGTVKPAGPVALTDNSGAGCTVDLTSAQLIGNGTTDSNVRSVNGTAVTGPDDFKADVSALALEATSQAIKTKTDQLNFTGNDVQSVASNMRGTDGASTHTPAQVADAIGTRQVPDAIAAVGQRPTYDQALYLLSQEATDFEITDNGNGTSTLTIKKPDNTTLATLTLNGDQATPPTSKARAT